MPNELQSISLTLFGLLILLPSQTYSQNSTVTITADPAYIAAPNCVAGCLYAPAHQDIGYSLKCPSAPYDISCYCPTGNLESAVLSGIVPGCVTTWCGSSGQDSISVAVSIYSKYCAKAALATRSTAQTTTSASQSPTMSVLATTLTSGSSNPTVSHDQLSLGNRTALAVGISIGIGVLILTVYTFMKIGGYPRRVAAW